MSRKQYPGYKERRKAYFKKHYQERKAYYHQRYLDNKAVYYERCKRYRKLNPERQHTYYLNWKKKHYYTNMAETTEYNYDTIKRNIGRGISTNTLPPEYKDRFWQELLQRIKSQYWHPNVIQKEIMFGL